MTGLSIATDGANAADFTVTASPTAPVLPGGSTTFTIQFAPATTGAKSAALHIANNVVGKNPYDISLIGQVLLFTADTDGDGLNDASEFQMAALGFNWLVNQGGPGGLVNALTSNLNGAGYFTPSQVQALNVGVPLIQRNATTGEFKLTIGLEKSTNLGVPNSFVPFPFIGAGTVINGEGKIEFLFTAPDNAAFFRLQSQ